MTHFNNECYFCILYKMNINFKIISRFLLITLIMSGCAIDKGFKSLDVYDYFDAKQKFESVENRKLVPSSYGLSIIYQRNDNPFHNLDSALVKINSAYSNFSGLSIKKKERYQKVGVDSLSILKQRSLISFLYFKRALETNSVYGFQEFITKNEWSPEVSSATNLRDSLFFFENHEKGSASDYELFLKTYPNSIYKSRADKLYNKTFFKESTINNSIADYEKYILVKPNSDFVAEAQNSIFKLSTTHKTISEYDSFISDFPANRNVNMAWMLLYDKYMQNRYSINDIEQFLTDYSNFPFKHRISNELFMANVKFYNYKFGNKWGFVSEDGKYYIEPQFDFVEEFSEGLAVVNLDGKIGYLTKTNDMKIEPQFDDGFSFENGFAVVEMKGLFGLINRSGEYIVNPVYDDLGNVNNELLYFEKNGKKGFFNTKGVEVIFPQYSDAYNFKNKLAIVEKNNLFGVIDSKGSTRIEIKHEAIKMIGTNLFAVKIANLWGVVNHLNELVLAIEYDYIGVEQDTLIVVEKENQFNYWDIENKRFITKVWFDRYAEYKVLALFNNGFAKVKTRNGYNFINKRAEFLFDMFYINLGEYNTNIAFEDSKGWGYINEKGKVIVKPNYTKTISFNRSGGVVEIGENRGLIDNNGEILLPIYFEEVKLINDTLVILKKNNYYGMVSNFKDTIVQLKYNLIEPISSSIVKVSSNSELTYYNFRTNSWLKKEE